MLFYILLTYKVAFYPSNLTCLKLCKINSQILQTSTKKITIPAPGPLEKKHCFL